MARVPIVAGVLLHAYTVLVAADGPLGGFALLLFLASCLPYGIAWGLPRVRVRPGVAAGYAWAALAGDLLMHATVFIWPQGSTAAIGLLIMPVWNVVVLGPAGLFLAWGVLWVAHWWTQRRRPV